jgi:hypothetical protein
MERTLSFNAVAKKTMKPLSAKRWRWFCGVERRSGKWLRIWGPVRIES